MGKPITLFVALAQVATGLAFFYFMFNVLVHGAGRPLASFDYLMILWIMGVGQSLANHKGAGHG